jgi:hypothetical protein
MKIMGAIRADPIGASPSIDAKREWLAWAAGSGQRTLRLDEVRQHIGPCPTWVSCSRKSDRFARWPTSMHALATERVVSCPWAAIHCVLASGWV